ncbi:uncharacterized protein RAG0_01969 [Rhynchosporium agropyri]|uniref:Pre-mRNA splicing factor CLF1 n=1 Tax=Rhynchosporium agropyri TaxID=914238 RepID=A0A1E1JZE3_9HELO|nr:uncharacterized protein RAG0_01969 [Rhynchosporium agropyri]
MALPVPMYSLNHSCSALFNNTLYTYSATAFQSLKMERGAEWSTLAMGVPVTGGVCVKSTPVNDTSAAALYIVGGNANDTNYQGLQRYTFSKKTWESITPTVAVTQNRLYHDSVYLNASDTILIYAGTQDGSKQLSSQTFTIEASPPHTVLAYEADAPPAISPILIQWTESKAMYIGGSETNTKAMIFSPSKSWVDSKASFSSPIYNTSNVKAVALNGNDGSKTIYTFDMTISPNTVNRTILIDANGNPVQNSPPVREKHVTTRNIEERAQLTVADWPEYNGTLAPKETRTSFSLAKDQSGMVVVTGGNDDDVLCIFRARSNAWANATAQLSSKAVSQQGLGSPPSTLSSTPASPSTSPSASPSSPPSTSPSLTAASSPESSTEAAVSAPDRDTPFPTKIVAAVIGSIAGAALILVALLLCFRWRRKSRQHPEAGHQSPASERPEEKNVMDFADGGFSEMATTRHFQGHEPSDSKGSVSSMAILMGRVAYDRGDDDENGRGVSNQFNLDYKGTISKPIPPQEPPVIYPRDEKTVSFAEGRSDRPPLSGIPVGPRPRGSTRGQRRGSTRRSSGWNRYWSGRNSLNILGFGSKRTTYEGSDRSSEYSIQQMPTHGSAVVPPLNVSDRPELNRVASGSPTVAHPSNKFPLSGAMSGQIERSGSISSMSSFNDDRYDAYSSGVPASVSEHQNGWNPVGGVGGNSAWNIRTSNYSESVYTTTINDRDTRFPSVEPGVPRLPTAPSADMSWLNLGGGSRI